MTEGRRLLLLALARVKIRYMALRLGVRPSAVYNWRSGRFVPGTRCRDLLEKIYGIPSESWGVYIG